MKVLICEDEEIMLTALSFRMKKHGFEVILASDGQEAYQQILTNKPDVIVTDIMVPHISGLELLAKLRNEHHIETPVIMISALEQEETILEAFRRGANDFIAKPFKPSELIVRIKRIIQEQDDFA